MTGVRAESDTNIREPGADHMRVRAYTPGLLQRRLDGPVIAILSCRSSCHAATVAKLPTRCNSPLFMTACRSITTIN